MISDGTASDSTQAYAICKMKWDDRSQPTDSYERIKEQQFLEKVARVRSFAGAKQLERWYNFNEDPDNVCPICQELADLGWVDYGLLPEFKKAHSVIGEGKWKAPDSSCQCRKGYKRVGGTAPENIIPISGYTGPNSIANPRLNFEEMKYTPADEAKAKIALMKQKYGNHNCNH